MHCMCWSSIPGMDPEYPVNQMYLDELRKDADRQFIDVEKHAAELRRVNPEADRVRNPEPTDRTPWRQELQADLIILGTHGRTGLQHVLVGSTAERVVRTGPCPVLSVKTGLMDAPGSASAPADRTVGHSPHIGTHRLLRMFSRCAGVCDPVCKAHGSIGDHSSHTGTGALQPGFQIASLTGLERKERLSARQAPTPMRDADGEPYQSRSGVEGGASNRVHRWICQGARSRSGHHGNPWTTGNFSYADRERSRSDAAPGAVPGPNGAEACIRSGP